MFFSNCSGCFQVVHVLLVVHVVHVVKDVLRWLLRLLKLFRLKRSFSTEECFKLLFLDQVVLGCFGCFSVAFGFWLFQIVSGSFSFPCDDG